MALTSLVADAAGDSGASSSVFSGAGNGVVAVTDSADLTGVTVAIQYSQDDAEWVTIGTLTSITNGDAFTFTMPTGYIRVNITGGGAGDNIDVGYLIGALASASAVSTVDTVVDSILVDTANIDENTDTLVGGANFMGGTITRTDS